MTARRATVVVQRWWACDAGHTMPISDDAEGELLETCPNCADGETYRVECGVSEDDPTRVRPAPTVTFDLMRRGFTP